MTLKVHRIFFFQINKILRKQKNFQVKSCGRTGSNKNIRCCCNSDEHRKRLQNYLLQRKERKRTFAENIIPQILKEQTRQREEKPAFDLR